MSPPLQAPAALQLSVLCPTPLPGQASCCHVHGPFLFGINMLSSLVLKTCFPCNSSSSSYSQPSRSAPRACLSSGSPGNLLDDGSPPRASRGTLTRETPKDLVAQSTGNFPVPTWLFCSIFWPNPPSRNTSSLSFQGSDLLLFPLLPPCLHGHKRKPAPCWTEPRRVHGEAHVGRSRQPAPAHQPCEDHPENEPSSLSQASPTDALRAEKSCPQRADF